MIGKVVPALVVVGLLAAQVVSGTRLDRMVADRSTEDVLLYLPNGKHLKIMALGQEALLADLFYLWAIQYYSNYEREDRYRYVHHIFGEVIGELNPNYVDAYWIGAMILTTEGKDLDGGLALLERGIEANPDKWILPYLAGWECFNFQEYERAGEYFERAASVPGAPTNIIRLKAGMESKAGDLEGALREWTQLRDDPASDSDTRAIAKRRVKDLTVQLDLRQLNQLVKRFRSETGRSPGSMEDLVRGGYLPFVPDDPNGTPYALERETGRVVSSASRLLGEGR